MVAFMSSEDILYKFSRFHSIDVCTVQWMFCSMDVLFNGCTVQWMFCSMSIFLPCHFKKDSMKKENTK